MKRFLDELATREVSQQTTMDRFAELISRIDSWMEPLKEKGLVLSVCDLPTIRQYLLKIGPTTSVSFSVCMHGMPDLVALTMTYLHRSQSMIVQPVNKLGALYCDWEIRSSPTGEMLDEEALDQFLVSSLKELLEQKSKLVPRRASGLDEFAKQFETWMDHLIESGDLIDQDRYSWRRSYLLYLLWQLWSGIRDLIYGCPLERRYSLRLPNGELNIKLTANSEHDDILMNISLPCSKKKEKKSSLTLRRLRSSLTTPVFVVVGTNEVSNIFITEQLAKCGGTMELTQEVLEDYLLSLVDKKDLALVEMEAGR